MHEKKTIHILYEDQWLIAFDKPAGLLVIPTPKKEKNTLDQIVNRLYVSPTEMRFFPCHRLDRDTSGVILFAKGKSNQQLMMEEFHRQRVEKTYVAFVQGRMKKSYGELRSFVKDVDAQKFRRQQKPKLSITRFQVLDIHKNFSVVELYPLTGRTNQIRIQMAQIGHPLLGERKYAFGRDYDLKFRRTALHALTIQFFHPITQKKIKIHSPWPVDMEQFLQKEN